LIEVELHALASLADVPGINEALKNYIETIERSEIQISALTDEQVIAIEKAHPEFCCTISHTLMEIPVLLDQKKYDLRNLLEYRQNGNMIDPFSRIPFQVAEIIRDLETRAKMVEVITPLIEPAQEEKGKLLPNAM
jgi:hypothetical protein